MMVLGNDVILFAPWFDGLTGKAVSVQPSQYPVTPDHVAHLYHIAINA